MNVYLVREFGLYNFLLVHLFAGDRSRTIEFPYAGYTVTVEFDDEFTVLIE
jgi:hypothetical protein